MQAFLDDQILETLDWLNENYFLFEDDELWVEIEQELLEEVYPSPPPSSQ